MSISLLEELKFNTNEVLESTLTDDQLNTVLKLAGNDVLLASYKVCLMKASQFKKIKVGGIEQTNYDVDYYLNLANIFKAEYDAKNQSESGGGYKTSMVRSDEIGTNTSTNYHKYYY